MLTAVKHTGAWKFARGVKRWVSPPRVDGKLPAEQCRSRVTILEAPVALEAGQRFSVLVKLENLSGVAYATAGDSPVSLRVGWRTPAGGDVSIDGPPTDIPLLRPAFPGEPQTFSIPVTAPEFVGDFKLHVDFVQAGGFTERNACSVAGETAIPVQGRRSTDIDYHAVYRTADLDANHWWVVGAYHSKGQYERSSRDRMDMLRKHGLTPDSRVLDIGCGTGQMAGPLMPFLTDRGAYYGTDIGAEAVAFCDRTFRRRNFVFRQGGMTTVPFDAADGPFDVAIFFSVFTHTFPDETALLLGETCRLLKPTGCVIADVIVSPLVERGQGHRGEMVLNRTHFERLAGMLGMHADVIGRWEWNRHAERLMYRLRRG